MSKKDNDKDKNALKQVLIMMPVWMHEMVKKEAKSRDSSSVSSVIRHALDAYLNKGSIPHGWDSSFGHDEISDDIFGDIGDAVDDIFK